MIQPTVGPAALLSGNLNLICFIVRVNSHLSVCVCVRVCLCARTRAHARVRACLREGGGEGSDLSTQFAITCMGTEEEGGRWGGKRNEEKKKSPVQLDPDKWRV